MKTSKIFQLHFQSPLHLSDVRADYGQSEKKLHSDTLTAAIMQVWAILGKEDWIKEDYGFTVSSLFPFTTVRNEPHYFFPKPFLKINVMGDTSEIFKKLKKTEYLDWEHFKAVCLGKELESRKLKKVFNGAFMTSHDIDKDFMYEDIRVRIVKNRNDALDSTPFYMEQINFKIGSGLWGMVSFDNEEAEKKFKIAIEYLQDSGLCTDRNIGNGQFKCEWDNETEFDIEVESDYALNLSLFCPENHDQLNTMLSDNSSSYDIVKRGGWLSEPYNTLRKRSVIMFSEGSIFKTNRAPKGAVVNLQPTILKKQHPVWRSGRALFLPVKINP